MMSKTTFHVRQATSMVVGWTGEIRCQESTVKAVKQGGHNLRRKGKDLIPNRNFSTMRMIRHRTFPSKDESTNGGRGHQTTKNAKKADATASTQAPPLR